MELLKDVKLIKKNGTEIPSTEEYADSIVGFYFSASWCPPCRQFTSLLADTYQELRKRGSKFEIVFLSSDKNKEEMMCYFNESHGDWLAVSFGQQIIHELQEKFSVTAIPKLIIVSPGGEVITSQGRKEVSDRGVAAFRTWSSKSIVHTSNTKSSAVNEDLENDGDGNNNTDQ